MNGVPRKRWGFVQWLMTSNTSVKNWQSDQESDAKPMISIG
jgi:hypothetical protein